MDLRCNTGRCALSVSILLIVSALLSCKQRSTRARVSETQTTLRFSCAAICQEEQQVSLEVKTVPCPDSDSLPSCAEFNVNSLPLDCRYQVVNSQACTQTAPYALAKVTEQIDTKKSLLARTIDGISVVYQNLNSQDFSPEGQAGLQALVNLPIEEIAIPYKVAKHLLFRFSEKKLWFAGGFLPSPFPDQFEKKLPIGTGRNLIEMGGSSEPLDSTNLGCLLCHAGSVGIKGSTAGDSVLIAAGIPNKDLNIPGLAADFKLIPTILDEGFQGSAIRTAAGLTASEVQTLTNSWSLLKYLVVPAFSHAKSRGAAPIGLLQYAEIPYWSQNDFFTTTPVQPYPQSTRENFIERFNPSVRPLPWWGYKHKKHALWVPLTVRRLNSEVIDDEDQPARDFAYAFQHADTGNYRMPPSEKFKYMKKIFSYVKEVSSPRYPAPLDSGKIERGSVLFHGSAGCAGCHGSYKNYGEFGQGQYKICYSQWLEDAGTDIEYRKHVDDITKVVAPYVNGSKTNPKIDTYDTSELPPGYLPPVLEGVWAVAPYFHNGSVPDLWSVLNSRLRPSKWAAHSAVSYEIKNDFSNNKSVGVVYNVGGPTADYPVHDASQRGYSNKGHNFGDNLSDNDRSDIIEFLLDVSGKKVIPDPNRVPIGKPEHYDIEASVSGELQSLRIEASNGVLSNDNEGCVGGKTARLTEAGIPTHGKVTLNPDGSFFYTATEGYKGEDSFKYRVFSGQYWSREVRVTLTVK